MANLQRNELQLEGRINNQILGVKGLRVMRDFYSHILQGTLAKLH